MVDVGAGFELGSRPQPPILGASEIHAPKNRGLGCGLSEIGRRDGDDVFWR